MIKVTVQECCDAYRALKRVNEEIRLEGKVALRVARLLRKLKAEVVDFEETKLKLFLDAGGTQVAGGVEIAAPKREDGESAEDWLYRETSYRATINRLNEEVLKASTEAVEIDCDPLSAALFDDPPHTPLDRQKRVSANDLADAMPFIADKE